jgi:GNAT superfamily N-acetyltransferase
MSEVVVEPVSGSALAAYVPALAALRIEVFREFPYLYDGTLDYEARYLQQYLKSQRSLIVIARAGDEVVGASTAMPLLEQLEPVVPTFKAAGIDPAGVYYFGESVLRASYRGRGIGHAFFAGREARALELGFSSTAFCAVERPSNHPRRPADYVPHDAFWSKRGYRKHPDLRTEFAWRDLDESVETPKPMLFWRKVLV